MKKSKQFSFFKDEARSQKFFGGVLLQGRRKSIRPLTSKDSIHFVLRSSWAVGLDSFLKVHNRRKIDQIINRFAKKFGVRIYHRAINSNHLHLLLRITNRRLYRSFIKAVSGQIASHVMGQRSFLEFSRTRVKPFRGDGSKSSHEGQKNAEVNADVSSVLSCDTNSNTGYDTNSEISSGFWQFRPFSRIVNWGRDFKMCMKYLKQNILEAFGFVPYQPRKNNYTAWIKRNPQISE